METRKIAFASCMDATRVPNQRVWTLIQAEQPDMLLLLGDQIYMDWGFAPTNWHGHIVDRQGAVVAKALDEFAAEMHRRYALQAAVPEFQALLKWMKSGKRPVLLTWDDHDFAWNNSVGSGDAMDKHVVPPEVKARSRALFMQFKAYVTGDLGAAYPAMPPPDLRAEGVQDGAILAAGAATLPVTLLDTRWYRTERSNKGTILGPQRTELVAHVQRAEGLAIVAAGSPLKHQYMFAEQDWVGLHAEDVYPEYDLLLQSARRPVLYLSGDIHRLAWSGRITSAAAPDAPVLQALASPVGIGTAGPKHFTPGYGVVAWTPASPHTGHVDIHLRQLQPEGVQTRTIGADYDATHWTTEGLGGEAAASSPYLEAGSLRDAEPIAVFLALARSRTSSSQQLQAPLDATEAIDAAYAPLPLPFGMPEAMTAGVTSAGGARQLTLTPEGNLTAPDAGYQLMAPLIRKAFERAARMNRTSVALYIHGLGNSPTDAISDGFALRELYGCEPIVFCWPAGWGDGPLARYFDVFEAQRYGQDAIEPLKAVLQAFCACTSAAGVPRLIVARSAGAELLRQLIEGMRGDGSLPAVKDGIDRILLSSPAIKSGDFGGQRSAWRDLAPGQAVVTVNEQDATLGLSRLVQRFGAVLGCTWPPVDPLANVTYLNFTASPAVGPLHNYLLLDSQGALRAAHQRVLCGKGPLHLNIPGVTPAGPAGNLFNVE